MGSEERQAGQGQAEEWEAWRSDSVKAVREKRASGSTSLDCNLSNQGHGSRACTATECTRDGACREREKAMESLGRLGSLGVDFNTKSELEV